MNKELSVIIPAYNEEKLIAGTLEEVAAYFMDRGYQFEVLVMNDGSRDRTAEIVRQVSKRFPQVKLIDRKENRGKGQTLREGFALARFRWSLFMDADNSVSIHEWAVFEEKLAQGDKAVIASRHLPGSKIIVPQPLGRRIFGMGYRVLCRILFGLKASDFNCGFKAYETQTAKLIYGETIMNDWTFDTDVFCRMKRHAIQFSEVPVTWRHFDKTSHKGLLATAQGSFLSVMRLKRALTT
jgi:glycosyltransferase involved in cell wall biosynthesis